MRKRFAIPIAAAIVVVVAIVVVFFVLLHERVPRHRVFRPTPAGGAAKKPVSVPPVGQWTDTFDRLPPADLEELLDEIEKKNPDLYARYQLAYVDARMLIEKNDLAEAAKKIAPYLDPKSGFRDLALYHQAEISDGKGDHAAASRARQQLIGQYPQALYRDQAIDDEADYLQSMKNPAPLVAFVHAVTPSASTERRRELAARVVESELRAGNTANAFANGIALLTGMTTDDAAERVSRALDRNDLIARMNPQQKGMLGDALFNHRHFDRAIAVLTQAAAGLPAKRDELQFAIGRCWFGDEKYAQAQQAYLRGAAQTADPKWKPTFLWHASRAAQLQDDDATAEKLMTQVIALPGRTPAALAALTQRIRTRAKQHRLGQAASDLQLLRKNAPNDHSLVEASLAFACAQLAAGNPSGAVATLNSVPPKLLNKMDVTEYGYWRARALEARDPHAAFNQYLAVMRATVPTHFAYFARERLQTADMQSRVTQELAVRDAQVKNLIAAKQWAAAKQIQTDRILLSTRNRDEELQRLASIYKQIPAYASVLELQPDPLPKLPNVNPADRTSLLMALGLYDEAAPQIIQRYPLRPLRAALTRSVALNRGDASRDSIYAIEVMMKSVPPDYLPDLLPISVRTLLYPRYFYPYIAGDAKRFGADPTLVLSIMREESRFNPRAKSQAAARGLLQFIITTARDIGIAVGLVNVTPEDLYDPRVIITLGAKYISQLEQRFAGDHYMTAGSYNAGPNQVALWARLAPAQGDDWFMSSINFDETKDYVRKVMNSYRRYSEIYGNAGPQGGLRAEP